jgi:hypothetical protein
VGTIRLLDGHGLPAHMKPARFDHLTKLQHIVFHPRDENVARG